MSCVLKKTRTLEGISPDAVPYDELLAEGQPTILKGLVRHWPLVQTGSPERAAAYLKNFYNGRRVVVFTARPELKGRFGYTEDATRLDFEADRALLRSEEHTSELQS